MKKTILTGLFLSLFFTLAAFTSIAEAQDEAGNTALMVAAANNNLQEVQRLIANKVNVDARNYHNQTALMWAAINGHLEIVRDLIVRGSADVHARDNDGISALIQAAYNNDNKKIVEYLLVYGGANIKDTTDTGQTALMAAVFNGNKEIMDYLLSKGANIKAKDFYGRTVLDFAGLSDDIEFALYVAGLYTKAISQ